MQVIRVFPEPKYHQQFSARSRAARFLELRHQGSETHTLGTHMLVDENLVGHTSASP